MPPKVSKSSNAPVSDQAPRGILESKGLTLAKVDLRNQIVDVGGVLMTQATSDAFRNLAAFVFERKGANLLIKTGFISRYKLVEDLCKLIRVDETIPPTLQKAIQLVAKPNDLDIFLRAPGNVDALEAALQNLKVNQFNGINKAFRKYNTTVAHPFLQNNVTIYGAPNYPNQDPRRSGKMLIFNELSDDIFTFLLYNAADYGFAWYGIDKTYWTYEGDSLKQKANAIRTSLNTTKLNNINVLTNAYV